MSKKTASANGTLAGEGRSTKAIGHLGQQALSGAKRQAIAQRPGKQAPAPATAHKLRGVAAAPEESAAENLSDHLFATNDSTRATSLTASSAAIDLDRPEGGADWPRQVRPLKISSMAWQWGLSETLSSQTESLLDATLGLDPEAAAERQFDTAAAAHGEKLAALLILATAYQLPAWIEAATETKRSPAAKSSSKTPSGDAVPLWQPLAEMLRGYAADAVALPTESRLLEHQLLSVELPLVLLSSFPGHSSARQWSDQIAAGLATVFEATSSESGMPYGKAWSMLPILVLSLLRCKLLSAGHKGIWSADNQTQLRQVTSKLAALVADRKTLVGMGAVAPLPKECLQALAEQTKDPLLARRFALSTSRATRGEKKSTVGPRKRKAPEGSHACDDAQAAILRAGWQSEAPLLTLQWNEDCLQGELVLAGERVACGAWSTQIQVNGRTLAAAGEWDSTCFVSDDDVAYLELELPLEQGWRLQRQFCLGKKTGFVFGGDALLGPRNAELQYQMQIPLSPTGVRVRQEKETFETWLKLTKQTLLLMPLEFPEWRLHCQQLKLTVSPAGLQMQLHRTASAVYLPWWIETKPVAPQTYTWRQLTVAEQRQIVARDLAVGYRVQTGNRQHLIYRSLAAVGNRTVLGHNTVSEFVLGTFGKQGLVDPLIEIE